MPVKQPLSRERVLRAAVDLVDQEGLESLTMRRLGAALGVEAMSLYRHVNGRGALLDGIHEAILSELEEPPKSAKWQESVRGYARGFREVLIAHPNSLVLFATRPAVTPASLRHIDRGLAVLRRDAGFTAKRAVSVFQVLVTYVVGHALSTHAVIPKEEETTPAYESATDMPYLVESSAILLDRDLDEEFEYGLDALILGLETKLTANH